MREEPLLRPFRQTWRPTDGSALQSKSSVDKSRVILIKKARALLLYIYNERNRLSRVGSEDYVVKWLLLKSVPMPNEYYGHMLYRK